MGLHHAGFLARDNVQRRYGDFIINGDASMPTEKVPSFTIEPVAAPRLGQALAAR
jgi:hypothetical protein